MLPPTFLLAAAAVSGLLVAVERQRGRRALWRVAGGVATALSAFALAVDYPYREVAPIGLVLVATLPVLQAGAVARGGRQWPWPATWVVATFTAAVTVMPAYAVGCVVSYWLPVPGCFF